jgi:hypothetical protein
MLSTGYRYSLAVANLSPAFRLAIRAMMFRAKGWDMFLYNGMLDRIPGFTRDTGRANFDSTKL